MERPSGSDGAPREKASHARLILALRVALVVVGLAPFVAPLVRRASPALGELFYVLFTPVCHRNPARTLSIASELMPICSRCAGIFAGFVTAGAWPLPRFSVRVCLGYGFVASVIMLVDVATQDLGVHPVWHPIRLVTGILWGHVFGLGVLAIAREHVLPRLRATSSA